MVTARELKRFRKRYGLSREEIAVEIGVSAQTVWRWEGGQAIPTPSSKLLQRFMAEKAQNGTVARGNQAS